MTDFRLPWDPQSDPAPTRGTDPPAQEKPPKPRGRRPADATRALSHAEGAPAWRYRHLIVSGPSATVAAFAVAARGAGVTPWQLDFATIEEDIFNMAAARPAARRNNLTIAGCRILARQFRERVEQRQARAHALVGHGKACPFDLHALLPVPQSILALGPTHPRALAWLAAHWGVTDRPRQVALLPRPTAGRRLPKDHTVIGYGFFTGGGVAQDPAGFSPRQGHGEDTPHAAIATLGARFPALRFTLRPRPAD